MCFCSCVCVCECRVRCLIFFLLIPFISLAGYSFYFPFYFGFFLRLKPNRRMIEHSYKFLFLVSPSFFRRRRHRRSRSRRCRLLFFRFFLCCVVSLKSTSEEYLHKIAAAAYRRLLSRSIARAFYVSGKGVRTEYYYTYQFEVCVCVCVGIRFLCFSRRLIF